MNNGKNDSNVVLAYVMLMIIILFGIGIGWVGHMVMINYRDKPVCHGENN